MSLLDRVSLVLVGIAVGGSAEESVCKAGEACNGVGSKQESYFWPTAHGHWKHYARSPHDGPFNLSSSLAWSWHHPDGPYHEMLLGSVIDDAKNVYVSGDVGIYKLSPDGKLLWKFKSPHYRPGNYHPNAASIHDGILYSNSVDGYYYAIDMETGEPIWIKKLADAVCCDTGFVTTYQGTIISHIDPADGGCTACKTIVGLSTSTGETLWKYKPDNTVWDLMAQFPGDGTFVFQDVTGKGYRNHLANGTNIWKDGGWPDSWTDGTQMLGPNNLLYTVNTNGCGGPGCHGHLVAHDFNTGKVVWMKDVPEPPFVAPAVGELRKGDGLSVVLPVGALNDCNPAAFQFFGYFPFLQKLPQGVQEFLFRRLQNMVVLLGDRQQMIFGNPDQPFFVYVFNAETGAIRWVWEGPVYKRIQAIGDEKGSVERMGLRIRTASCPALPSPRIGSDGTIYVQHKGGYFFAINDFNGDGRIDPEKEVSRFDCESDFSSIGSAHAPGMIVATSGSKVWAFKS